MVRGGGTAQEGLPMSSQGGGWAGLGWTAAGVTPASPNPTSPKGANARVWEGQQDQLVISETGRDGGVQMTSQRPPLGLPSPCGHGPGPSPLLPCAGLSAGLVARWGAMSGQAVVPLGAAC